VIPAWWSQPRLTAGLGALCALVALPLGARVAAFEPYVCPGLSMFPAIHPGDRFIGERAEPGDVHRGDVVLLRNPTDTTGVVVKRVVGLGGDTVWVHDGTVELNGAPVPRCEVGPMALLPGLDGTAYVESLDGRPYATLVLNGLGAGSLCTDAPCRVADGELFVLGDNRDDSVDSRTWGSVPERQLLGRAPWVDAARQLPAELAEGYARCTQAR